MSESDAPRMDGRVRELLTAGDSGDTVVLVGLDGDDPRATEDRLAETVEKVAGAVDRALGFGVYRVTVPVARIDVLRQPWVDYVEAPDEDGAPEPQGN